MSRLEEVVNRRIRYLQNPENKIQIMKSFNNVLTQPETFWSTEYRAELVKEFSIIEPFQQAALCYAIDCYEDYFNFGGKSFLVRNAKKIAAIGPEKLNAFLEKKKIRKVKIVKKMYPMFYKQLSTDPALKRLWKLRALAAF